jgi:uncharacterized integral membrane protein
MNQNINQLAACKDFQSSVQALLACIRVYTREREKCLHSLHKYLLLFSFKEIKKQAIEIKAKSLIFFSKSLKTAIIAPLFITQYGATTATPSRV